VIEKISDEKKDKLFHAIFLENRYIKIMILPELGGRVHMAYDKVKKRHFIYYNQVIKPALVGLTGPWISGGIEFNWPQHHRPSTFLPTDYSIEEHSDGSKTVWCNEVERMFRTKGMQGFKLHPDKAYLEINVKIYNRTPFPQTFLWWANPAVVVHKDYHSVFPPDVNAVFDHGKRDVSSFPIATGTYYKVDYSSGVDISKYKNIPVPTSYMAIKSKYDFVGGYEQNIGAGLLHVANHHVSPGKKQWTWGCGDFGIAWDRNLTDEDGPYIELMTGVYTDNQPDFSWLQPYEEKSWTQYFMPYSEVGYVKNATKDAIVNLEVVEDIATIILYTTSEYKDARILLKNKDGRVYIDKTIDISPENPFTVEVKVDNTGVQDLELDFYDHQKKILVSYRAEKDGIKPIPDPVKAARRPKDIASIEQLYLTGLHLEQYRHATYDPMDYYLEALRREPGDVRCNNATGLLLMRKGRFQQAESYFRTAIATLTERNPNPYDGEPSYNLGWSCKMQGKLDDAYEAFYKSAWNAAWQDPAYFAIAQIDAVRNQWESALENADRCLIRNWHNHKARQLKTSILRISGKKEDALQLINESLHIDRFNIGCLFEKYLLTGNTDDLHYLKSLIRDWKHNYIEYSLDFSNAGLYAEAEKLLKIYIAGNESNYPMAFYALGYFASKKGETEKAKVWYDKAEKLDPDFCFPNRLEEILILEDAISTVVNAPKALYYLGNFWYATRQYSQATACWEKSATLNDKFPTVLRNLSLAYYNKLNRKEEARNMLEKAFHLDETDARIFMELDQLYKKMGLSPDERLAFLEKYANLVEQRDDLSIERIALYCQLGQFQEAKDMIDSRKFHPWEGGEGKITGLYTLCRVELAKKAIAENRFFDALVLLNETNNYPHNLGEGKLYGAEENDIHYYKGIAYKGLNDLNNSEKEFKLAVIGSSEPKQAFFYNDQQPDKILYQGLAWYELNDAKRAGSCFNKLIKHGEKHLFDNVSIDYFAVSLPDLAIWEDDLTRRNIIHCNYVMGLGYFGSGNIQKAKSFLEKVLELDINHQGALIHLKLCMDENNPVRKYFHRLARN
jgi:tetratricopeptide (TPR) repeat protein